MTPGPPKGRKKDLLPPVFSAFWVFSLRFKAKALVHSAAFPFSARMALRRPGGKAPDEGIGMDMFLFLSRGVLFGRGAFPPAARSFCSSRAALRRSGMLLPPFWLIPEA
jgi:hypothetical protein